MKNGFWGIVSAAVLSWTALTAVVADSNPQPFVDETRLTVELAKKVQELLQAEQFDQLDAIADEFRRTKCRSVGGYPRLVEFYSSFADRRSEEDWQAHLQLLQRWIDKAPASVTARIVLGDAYARYAWAARGGGWASSVTDDGWTLMKERLQRARQILEEAERLPTKDPGLYTALGRVALGQSWPRAQMEEVVRKCVALDPGYVMIYFSMGYYLLPRWFGKPGEWIAFAEQMADATKRTEGDSFYARMVWAMLFGPGGRELTRNEGIFKRNGISWPRVKQGFLDIEERHPRSLRNASAFCYLACLAGDRETAHQLFLKMGDQRDVSVWGNSATLAKWRDWADPGIPDYCRNPVGMLATDEVVTSVQFSPDGKLMAASYMDGPIVVWDMATKQLVAKFEDLFGDERQIRFSPDGRMLAAVLYDRSKASDPGQARLWDVVSKKELARLSGNQRRFCSLAFTPDMKSLVTTGGEYKVDGEIMIWDLRTFQGRHIKPVDGNGANAGLDNVVWDVAISPYGDDFAYVIGQCADICELYAERPVERRAKHPSDRYTHRYGATRVAFSPDGKILASSDRTGAVALWEASSGKPLKVKIAGHGDRVSSLAFSPDGRTLASSSWDQTVKLWDVATGMQRAAFLGHYEGVNDVSFSRDGGLLASASSDGTIRLWDCTKLPAVVATTATNALSQTTTAVPPKTEEEHSAVAPRNLRAINCLAHSPDGVSLAIGFRSGDVLLWDLVSNKERTRLGNLVGEFRHIAFSPNGRLLAVAARSRSETDPGEVKIWDIPAGKIYGPLVGHKFPVFGLAFTPDNKTLFTGGGVPNQTGEILMWDLRTLRCQPLDYQLARVVSNLAMSPDGKWLCFPQSRWVYFWNVVEKKLKNEELKHLLHKDQCVLMAFSPDSQILASADVKGHIRLSNPATGKALNTTLTGHSDRVIDMSFSRSGMLASASWDQTVKVWEPASGRELAKFSTPGKVYCVSVSRDGGSVAFGCSDGAVRVADLRSVLSGKPQPTTVTIPVQ